MDPSPFPLGEVVAGRAYERHAWVILFAVSLLGVWFAELDIVGGGPSWEGGDFVPSVTGQTWSELELSTPRVAYLIDFTVRLLGTYLLFMFVLTVVVSATGFRRGQRWAWYVMWLLPLLGAVLWVAFATVEVLPGSPVPAPARSAPFLLPIVLLGMILPYRRFFPKK